MVLFKKLNLVLQFFVLTFALCCIFYVSLIILNAILGGLSGIIIACAIAIYYLYNMTSK